MGDERERLEAAARERWGEAWFIKHYIDSTGDEQWYAEHTITRFKDGLVARDKLRLTDDGIEHTGPWVVDTKEYVAEISLSEDGAFNADNIRRLLEYEP
jgi:hypothetical protein